MYGSGTQTQISTNLPLLIQIAKYIWLDPHLVLISIDPFKPVGCQLVMTHLSPFDFKGSTITLWLNMDPPYYTDAHYISLTRTSAMCGLGRLFQMTIVKKLFDSFRLFPCCCETHKVEIYRRKWSC